MSQIPTAELGGRSRPFDWVELHRRLEDSHAAMEQKLNPDPEKQQEILLARAKLLAKPLANESTPSESDLETVEFVLASEHYGIEARYVREIHSLQEFTPLPSTPPFVMGIANIRGQILSILDIKKLFDLPEKGLTDLNKVICVTVRQIEVGILADAIVGMRRVSIDGLSTSLPTLTGVRSKYLKGVSRDSLIVLDIGKLLSDPRISVDKSKAKAE